MIYDSEKYKTETLKVLLERYNADRAYIFRFNEQEQSSTRICEVVAEGITPDKQVLNKDLSGALSHFKQGLPIFFNREEEIANSPSILAESIQIIKKHGIQSCLLVPILVAGKLWGYIGADTIKKARKWTRLDVEYMQAIAGVVAVTLGSNEKDDIINAFNKIRGRQLLQCEDKFRNILAAIPLAIVLYTKNGDYLECNNAMLKMFGYKSFLEVTKANLFTFDSEIANLVRKKPYHIEMAYNVASRKLYKDITDLPYSPELKYISIKIFSLDCDTDISQDTDNESCGQNRNGYLLLATEVQNHFQTEEHSTTKPEFSHTRSSFMANIGHEFITPLNAIIGFSELISLSRNQTERNMFYEIVENNRSQLINLIDELTEYSKIESGRMAMRNEAVDLGTVFTDLIGQLKTQHGNRINVYYPQYNKQEPAYIYSSREGIYKIFSNILNHLIKNMLQGNITISHCTDEMDEYGKTLIFSIKTPDLIIPPDKISSIFKKYTKLNEDAMGLDIGLAITKSLIEHLQGTITVTSKETNGTEFIIALPLEGSEKESGLENDNTTTNIHPSHRFENFIQQDGTITNEENNVQGENNMEEKRLDILLAEDIDFNYMLVNAIIGKKHNLTRAKTGKEAVDLFQKNKYNLILMDIKMPEMDGITATKLIREIDKEIPIIAVTAYAFDADKQVALEAGCNSYIVKPIDSKTLNNAIQEAANMEYNQNR